MINHEFTPDFQEQVSIKSNNAYAWNILGTTYSKSNLSKAIEAYQKALSIDPNLSAAWYNIGIAYYVSENLNKAIEAFKEAVKVDPNHARSWYNLGYIFSSSGNMSEAIKAYEKAVKNEPELIAAWNNLGRVYHETGKLNEAIKAYQNAASLESDNAKAWYNLGIVHSKKADMNKALEAYKKALNIDPDNANLWNNLGVAYIKSGNLKEAINSYQKAVSIEPDNAIFWKNLGIAYIHKQHPDDIRSSQDMNDNKMFFKAESLPQDAPPILFPDSAILEKPVENRKKINKKTLINQLNYVHFNEDTILIKMMHKRYGNEISLEAKPLPVMNNILTCAWIQVPGLPQKLQSYQFNYFLLSDGLKLIRVDAIVKKLDKENITLELPDFSYELNSRKLRRHKCSGIEVEFIQNGAVFFGRLVDFNTQALKIEIFADPPKTFQWIQPDQSASVVCKEGNTVYFSGEVNIVRYTSEQRKRNYVLEPLQDKFSRYKKKEIRCMRSILNPTPTIVFKHPFTKKIFTLPVCDISGSGFSVEENSEDSILISGMIIPEIELEIANNCYLKCISQIIYRKITYDEHCKVVKCGISILDMDVYDQIKMAGILQRSNNKNTFVCNRVNIDSLWKFLFETGFIYPQKYKDIYNNKEEFKKTYKKLYIEHPQIARHFIYQKRGAIQGHSSILRYFTNTWLFHHHASNSATFKGPGIIVLNQVCQYVNNFHQLYSAHMNYTLGYYREDNKFPKRIFGHFTEQLDDPKGCAIYPMAYLSYDQKINRDIDLPTNISIEPANHEDLIEIKLSIGGEHGNLIFHAFDFEQELFNNDILSAEYKRAGFKRKKYLYSVRIFGQLKAVFLVLVSETGINLSNLTNCIFTFVIDQEEFSEDILHITLSKFRIHYQDTLTPIPILIYPSAYAIDRQIQYEKIYNLWIFNNAYLSNFLKFLNKFLD